MKKLKNYQPLVLLVLLGFLLRLLFLSPYLEDWDSVQFALALENFSIVNHLPHPPGYPIYVLFGKLFSLIFRGDNLALTMLSATLGSLTIVPLFLVTKKMFDNFTAILVAIFFLITPISWTLSEVALTNIPGLFFLTFFVYLIYKFQNSIKNLCFVLIFGGLILGVRFTEISVILSLLAFIIIKKRYYNKILLLFGSFILGVLLWIIPLILITGFKEFIASYSWIANYVFTHDTLLGQEFNFRWLLSQRLNQLISLLNVAYTPFFVLLSIFVLSSVVLTRKYFDFKYQFILVWFFSYLIPLILIFNLEVPRYTLPLLSPILILFFSSFSKNKLAMILILVVSVNLLIQSLDQVTKFKNTVPPIISSVSFVKNNFNPKETIIISGITYRHFQYYAPEFQIVDVGDIKNLELPKNKASFLLRNKTVIIDYLNLKNQMNTFSEFRVEREIEFSGDKDIYSRTPKIELFILKKTK